jgi:ferredoxin-NADP reductase
MPQKMRCRVADIVPHGERVYSLFLEPERPAPRYLPGQFLHLALDPYQPGDFWPDSRVFSIASPPMERTRLRITYAVKGGFTARMESELRSGAEVWIKLPYGEFVVLPDSPACLLAGGTGITAFTAFLSGLPRDYPHPVHLFYGARRPELLIFRSLVEEASSGCSDLHAHFLIEEGASGGCSRGRINLDDLWNTIPAPPTMVYYLSGPPEMIRQLSDALQKRAIPADRILTDAWE